eukprot:Opistho-2@27522
MKKALMMIPLAAVTAALFGSLSAPALAQPAAGAGAKTERQVVTRADQLPRRNYTLDQLPSAYLGAPLEALKPLGALLEADILADLAAFDIQDPATLREVYSGLATLAQLRGDWAAVPGWTAKARALQEKAGAKLTSGVLTDLLAQQRLERRDKAWLAAEIQRRYGAMPWAEVQDNVKASKGGLETFNPELVVGAFKSQLDVMAQNNKMAVPGGLAFAIIGARLQIELLSPVKDTVVGALQTLVDARQQAAVKTDLWTPRTFAIPATAKAVPVVIGVWDSGVDLALFKGVPARGMAFDDAGRPAQDLLPSLGEAQPRWPQLRGLIKGAMDQRAALDTPDSRQFRSTMASLKADQIKAFGEEMGLAGLYVHGTHVAGIAVDGNPFA